MYENVLQGWKGHASDCRPWALLINKIRYILGSPKEKFADIIQVIYRLVIPPLIMLRGSYTYSLFGSW